MASSLYGSKGPTGSMPSEKIPKGYKKGSVNQFTPEQMQLFQQMFSQVGPDSYLSQLAGGDEEMFNEIEAPAMKQFSALQGNLASRFSGAGSLGARRSSGFQNTQNQAATDFAGQLQSQRQALQRQAMQDLSGLSDSLLNQRPQNNYLIAKQQQKSKMPGILGGAVGGVGGFLAGGPAGAATGAKLGYDIGSGF